MKVVDVSVAECYCWGDNCTGWHLLKSESISVIQEEVPAGKSEKRYYHKYGTQFFYILSGEAVMESDGNDPILLKSGQGICIEPHMTHKFKNESDIVVRFLVITAPKLQDDRIDLE